MCEWQKVLNCLLLCILKCYLLFFLSASILLLQLRTYSWHQVIQSHTYTQARTNEGAKKRDPCLWRFVWYVKCTLTQSVVAQASQQASEKTTRSYIHWSGHICPCLCVCELCALVCCNNTPYDSIQNASVSMSSEYAAFIYKHHYIHEDRHTHAHSINQLATIVQVITFRVTFAFLYLSRCFCFSFFACFVSLYVCVLAEWQRPQYFHKKHMELKHTHNRTGSTTKRTIFIERVCVCIHICVFT